MQKAWNDISKLLSKIKPLVLESGVPARQLKMPKADPDRIKIEAYTKIFDWLHDFKMSHEYENAVGIKNVLPNLVWQQYKDLDIQGLREQILLQKALKQLRIRWKKKRPQFLGRDFKHDQETNESDPFRKFDNA